MYIDISEISNNEHKKVTCFFIGLLLIGGTFCRCWGRSNSVGTASGLSCLRKPPISKALGSKWALHSLAFLEGINPFLFVAKIHFSRRLESVGNLKKFKINNNVSLFMKVEGHV